MPVALGHVQNRVLVVTAHSLEQLACHAQLRAHYRPTLARSNLKRGWLANWQKENRHAGELIGHAAWNTVESVTLQNQSIDRLEGPRQQQIEFLPPIAREAD